MLRVAYIPVNPDNGCSYYRSTYVLPYLNSKDLLLMDFSDKDCLAAHTWVNVDIVILQRPCKQSHVDIIRLAKIMGVVTISDYDDTLLHIPQNYPSYTSYDALKPTIAQCLSLVDEIWVSTPKIKEVYAGYNGNIHVIPNAHNDYIFPVHKKKSFDTIGKKISYRGSIAVETDLYEYLEPLVDSIKQNPEWQFNFIGSRFPYLESLTPENHTMSNPVALMDYFHTIHTYNPNIHFYPLKNTLFNQCKSNCSFLEATYAGAAFIGNGELEEFVSVPMYAINDNLEYVFKVTMNDLEACKEMNDYAWSYIVNNRLLSNINQLRKERLLKYE